MLYLPRFWPSSPEARDSAGGVLSEASLTHHTEGGGTMGKLNGRWFFLLPALVFAAFLMTFTSPHPGRAAGVAECLECHDDIDEAKFAASPHGIIQCVGCHSEVTDISKHEAGDIKINPGDCAKCH